MTLTKKDLKDLISNQLNLPKIKSNTVIETIIETIKDTLESGEDVTLSGFGKFGVKKKNERRGRNPATGEEIIIESRRVVTFHCSDVLKNKINGEN